MIQKEYTPTGRSCRVTFRLPASVNAERAQIVGEFTDWEQAPKPMKRQKDGSFVATVSLKPGRSYRFRYLLDGSRWENDEAADAYVANGFGSDDSVIQV